MSRTAARTPRRRRRVGRGVLLVMAAALMGSGLLRIGAGTGAAVAREVAGMVDPEAGDHTQAAEMAACEHGPEVAPLLAALQDREAAVEARELAVSDELLALERAREAIGREMAALREAEAQLEETLALADGAAESDLSKLTRMYEVMKPKEAAVLFEEMDPVFAAGFLGRMQPERAAAVLAGMEPKAAYRLSLILAGRNASVPTE